MLKRGDWIMFIRTPRLNQRIFDVIYELDDINIGGNYHFKAIQALKGSSPDFIEYPHGPLQSFENYIKIIQTNKKMDLTSVIKYGIMYV